MSSLDVLSNLEQRVSSLEAQLGDTVGLDTLQPNVITVSPTGQIGAQFTGLVNALGLIIPAGTSQLPPVPNRIEWTRSSDNALIASLVAWENSGQDTLWIWSQATAGNQAEVDVIAESPSGENTMNLIATANDSPGASSLVANSSGHVAQNATILNSAGQSDFVQKAPGRATAAMGVDFGAAALGWTTGQGSAVAVVTHELERQPSAILLGATLTANGYYVVPGVLYASVTASGFQVAGLCPQGAPGSGAVATVYWLIIG